MNNDIYNTLIQGFLKSKSGIEKVSDYKMWSYMLSGWEMTWDNVANCLFGNDPDMYDKFAMDCTRF